MRRSFKLSLGDQLALRIICEPTIQKKKAAAKVVRPRKPARYFGVLRSQRPLTPPHPPSKWRAVPAPTAHSTR
jgi:hypothetical protein